MITKCPFLKILRNPTFSVPRNPQSPILLGSNLGTKSHVLRSLWNLLLSNSHLFSLGYTTSPRFLSPGNTRRVPVTRPPGTTSRSNSPGYPRGGALPHAGDYSTLTNVITATYTPGRLPPSSDQPSRRPRPTLVWCAQTRSAHTATPPVQGTCPRPLRRRGAPITLAPDCLQHTTMSATIEGLLSPASLGHSFSRPL